MATEKRDIELAIRAKDLSSADLRRVAQTVRDLAGGIEAQAQAARKGQVSVAELKAALDQLDQAGRALANQQGLIDSYTKLSRALADSEAKAEAAKRALAEFSAEANKGAKLTETQAKAQENYAKGITNAETRLAAAQERLRKFNAGLKEGEALTEAQRSRQEKLVAAVARTEAQLSGARTRMDEFNASLARTSAERAANEQQRLARAAEATSAAAAKQRTELASLENTLREAGIDARDLAAAQQTIVTSAREVGTAKTALTTIMGSAARNQREAAQAAELQARADRDAAQASEQYRKTVQGVLAALRERQEAQERLLRAVRAAETAGDREAATAAAAEKQRNEDRLAQFRALADQAERTANSFRSLAAAQRGAASSEAQDAIAFAQGGLANENAPRRRTIRGIELVTENAATNIAALERARGPVENFVESLQDMERTLSRVQAVAKQVDGYRTQADATRRAADAYSAAQSRLRALQEEVRKADRPSDALAASLQQAAVAANNAGTALSQQRARLAQLGEGLREAGVDVNRLGEAQERLARVAATTADSVRRLQTVAQQRGVVEGQRLQLFGLSPNELQNLSFQVNDFFTQLASGTSVAQAFAQQIGQVVQIERVGTALRAALPAILAFGSAAAVAISALVRLNSQLALLRDARAQQAFSGGFSAETVARVANEANRLGLNFRDARQAALELARTPITAEQYEQATRTVANLRIAFTDGEQRAKAFVEALQGGVAGLIEFDNANGRLSNAQREFIANARTQADVTRAVSTFLRVYSDDAQRARDEATTPLSEALRALRTAWQQFLDSLATPQVISTLTNVINGLSGSIRTLTDSLRALGPLLPVLGAIASAAAGVRDDSNLLGRLAGIAVDSIPGVRAARTVRETVLPGLANVAERIPLPISEPRTANTASEEDQSAAIAAQGRIARDAADVAENRRRAALAAQEEARRLEQMAELERRIRRSTEERATAAERAAGVQAAADKARIEFARRLRVAEDSPEAQRAGNVARAEAQERVDEAARRAAEQNAREGLAERRRELTDIEQDISNIQRIRDDISRGIIEDVQAGTISSTEGLRRLSTVADQARTRFEGLADEAKRFADQNRGTDALRDARADALITRTRRLAEGGGENSFSNQLLAQSRQNLQNAVQERATFIQTINALEQQGAITTADAQERTRQAYAATNDSIVAQIDALETLVAELEALGRISPALAGSIRAQVELARAQLVFVDPAVARVRQAFQQSVVQSSIAGLNEVAEALGGVIAGTKEWGDVATAASEAVVNSIANVLRAVAEAILQQQILNAVQAASAFLFPSAAPVTAAPRVRHSGGIVGSLGGRKREVPAYWFANAPRYHSGKLVGLAPNEEAAVLERGEEVLTKDDPRNMLNMVRGGNGGGESSGTAIRNVLVMDESMIADAIAGAAGERVVINTLRKNTSTIRQILR